MNGGTQTSYSESPSWRKPLSQLHRWIEGPLAILYAPHCLLCGRSLDALCPVCTGCARALPRLSGPRCMVCQQTLPDNEVDLCIRCGVQDRGFSRVIALGPYSGPWRQLVLDLKIGKDRIVAGFLSTELGEELLRQMPHVPHVLTFVPMTSRERRSRGFNQSRLLAAGVARRFGLPVARLLTKQVDTARQSVLTARQRRENLHGAFRAVRSCPEPKSESVVLIDDVFTTGATAEACSHALLGAGYREVNVLVVARAEGSYPSG